MWVFDDKNNFLPFSLKMYVVSTYLNCLDEAILMNTHNIQFYEHSNEYLQYIFIEKYRKLFSKLSQLMRLWYLSHGRTAKAQTRRVRTHKVWK